jgi:hypothetical protein
VVTRTIKLVATGASAEAQTIELSNRFPLNNIW